MRLIGLTGGIGSGKTTVAQMLADRSATVIDADAIAREVVEPGTEAFDDIVERFGDGVVAEDGSLDRDAVAAIVFDDDDARADLNAIVHPRVGEEIGRRLASLHGDDEVELTVVDVPLLVESEAAEAYDAVIVVTAPEDVRVERLVRDRGMDPDDVRSRIAAQASDEERTAVATHVIENDGDLDALEARVDEVHRHLTAREDA